MEVGQFIESVSRGRQVLPFPFDLALFLLDPSNFLGSWTCYSYSSFLRHFIWPISYGTIDLAK